MSAYITQRLGTIPSERSSVSLPKYATELAAFHRAFADELRELVRLLPLTPEMRIVDVGCGDGFYLPFLAEGLNSRGAVVGLDSNAAYLNMARHNPALCGVRCRIDFVAGELDDLPRHCCNCDLIWCAQCLFSVPDPVEALGQMASMLRPGGVLAVLENDTLHQVLLPWPEHLEIELRAAEWQALGCESRQPDTFYVGRRLPAVFRSAGLDLLGYRTRTIDRRAPLDQHVMTFLQSYLERLSKRVRPYLDSGLADEFDELINPRSSSYLLRQPDFSMTWLNVLVWGRPASD
jgi:SAM-dependent methyltransferase